ncbi:hypothetical protein LAZ67_12000810 [Cordylochernes scorpioides]|uniref:Reverse transcriptase domain-containing protein n=1 Tax=Cordylochernes scorpioides TaxID=51811 RepID=A0ABY6L0U5_9ARAC|nr:hypothetical protein LAZ67_12000810 [Cordylochernes scorpioides]
MGTSEALHWTRQQKYSIHSQDREHCCDRDEWGHLKLFIGHDNKNTVYTPKIENIVTVVIEMHIHPTLVELNHIFGANISHLRIKKRIDAFMRICLRTTIGAPFNLSNKILKEDLNQPNIEEIYQDSATRLFSQFQKSSNPTIQEIVQNQGIEQNPGPPTKKQTTLTASVHSGERESIDGELKMLILNMATEIKSLGERIDIRLTKIETRMDDWDKRFCNIEEKLTKCIESQQATEKLASCNSLKVNELEARVEFFETRLREPNLVFYGIEREGDENQADCNLKIQNIIRDKMEIGDDLKITKCHRLSRGSNAPVLVVVPDYADRAKIFKNAYKLRDTKISISKDYSKNVREQRRILIAKRKELGERGIKSKLRDNKLLQKPCRNNCVNRRNTTSKSQINSPPHNQITESYYDINTCKYDSQDDDDANFSENSRDIAEKIICWNINGFYRILSIFPLLEHIKNYEIFALLETWCLNRTNITLKDYQIIELPATKESGRGRGSGGIIVGFREGGKYRVESSEKDGTWLSIFLSTNTRAPQHVICLIFVYLPPNQIQLHNLDKLFTYIQKQIADGKEIILLGDLNIRTGKLGGLHNPLNFQLPLTSERRAKDHIISSLSNKLLDFLEDNSLTIVNGRSRGDKDGDFTYISERGSSTIDYCILSQGSLQILLDFKVDDQLYSDHHPLVLTIKGQNFNEKKTKREDYNITRYRWSADGLAMFKMKLEELREKNIPASDDLVYTFNQRILEAMSSAKITYSIKGGPRKSKPWFDKDCYDMKKLAKESLKKYRKTNRLEDRECYASSRKKYLALLDLKRKGFDNEKQEILRNAKDSKTFWKTIALYKSTSIIQGEISIQDWLNFYRELMTTEKNLRICNLHNVISQNDPILDSEITNADIYKEIAGLRSNKACGPDGIPNEVLKTLPDSYILLLKQLYNSVMTTGKYPAIWTNSTIHPIFKNGYKNSPSNYRGIALISNVSKLFTSILRSRLEEWVEGRRVIPENQAGFRKERSCIDHIFTLTTLIQLSLRKKRGKLYVFFVDLRKAFDTVPHSLLWKKLYNLGISYQFISTIKSYYEQATIAIRWKGSFTESIKINSGVLQGEPLSPLLFILFITDLIEIYNNSDLPSVNLPEFGDIHLLLYADDIAIIGESRINLQKKIKILKEYLDENLMTLNESKSKIMVFRNGGKPSNKDRWFWNDKPIAITSRYTYLGFPLTPTITTTHPANYFKGKALTAINATHPILIKSKAKSINLSIKLFDTIVRAVLMYAAPLWATEHKDLLDNIQDIFIRRFLNLPRYTPGYLIRLETGRISLSVTALKLTLKYWLRVLNMSSDRLPRICFNRTRELSNASGTPHRFH